MSCTNPMGFSFSSDGWNYLIEQLKEFDRDPDIQVKDSILLKFHNRYLPTDMSDIPSSAGFEVDFKPGLAVYPWGAFDIEKNKIEGYAKNAQYSRFYGPSDFSLVEKDFFNLKTLYESIKIRGYRPWRYNNAFIGGVFLEKENGNKKYVILQGNHRTAILAHLGFDKVLARFLSGHHKIIREKDLMNWLYVKSGRCNYADAKAYFNSFFIVNGLERASRLGLLDKRN